MSHYNMVQKPNSILKAVTILEAEASLDKEYETLQNYRLGTNQSEQ